MQGGIQITEGTPNWQMWVESDGAGLREGGSLALEASKHELGYLGGPAG